MLEEYRYYEAIKRKRQENLNLIKLSEAFKDQKEMFEILVGKISNYSISKLKNGETTEILESQKQENIQLDILPKIIDLIKTIKGT